MHDIVPEAIRLDVRHRGRQSGDNVYRISQSWDKMKEKIEEALHSKETLHYLDVKQIDEMLLYIGSDFKIRSFDYFPFGKYFIA